MFDPLYLVITTKSWFREGHILDFYPTIKQPNVRKLVLQAILQLLPVYRIPAWVVVTVWVWTVGYWKPQICINLGGGFNYSLFSPQIGEIIQFDEHFFQMGWFNHQLDKWMFEFCSSMGCKYHPEDNEGFVPSSCPPVPDVSWEESRPNQGDGVTHLL